MRGIYFRITLVLVSMVMLTSISRPLGIKKVEAQNDCQSVNWFKYLGGEDYSVSAGVTPRYGITVFTYGFQFGRHRYVDPYVNKKNSKLKRGKTIVYLDGMGADHLIAPFEEFANNILDDKDFSSSYIANRIDDEYQRIWAIWANCPRYSSVAQNFDPRSLIVEIRATPWCVPEYSVWAAGMCEADGHHITLLVVGGDKVFSDPSHATLRRFDDLAAWEIGNAFSIAAHFPWKGIDHEVGDRDPCGTYLTTGANPAVIEL